MSRIMLLYATAPDAATARAIGAALVEARLAACVNVLGPVRSVYRWRGKVEEAEETAFLVKTTEIQAPAARDLILARHPYDTPAVLALPVNAQGSNTAFLAWVAAETGGDG